mmetsp:Transcript_27117/g.37424  ORF Transcript_27117/g.37424 Transcript_27117/m.37424 type:complete len:503 (+) Transcript_27117:130-1638(+)|eukprot:CAMPEP_0196599070 /NCGR_PEP_ID=MMETSP1081-20130531/94663_1 /TAXON_ID=36882 /ORGANISM="Pyramimonas amylifera, Strain CCMP720" /LENGTH=502 /DNA_ID=CAMNT_0041924819 /DNA_START=115 /DNA_END=1623 /DNA_ORIENTATION=-
MAEVDAAPVPEIPVPVAEETLTGEESAAVPELDSDGALGKRKPEEEIEAEEPQRKRQSKFTDLENEPESSSLEEVLPVVAVMDGPSVPVVDSAPAVTTSEPASLVATVVSFNQDITEFVDCPHSMVGRVIGKGGETIKSLEAQYGCKMQIDQETKKVSITGNQQAVKDTAKAVHDLLTTPNENIVANPPEASETIDCPAGLVGRIIGRGGETIKGLQAACGATVSIDQNFPQDHPRKIHISGAAGPVARGVKLVEELLQGGPATAAQLLGSAITPGFTIECPKEMVGRIIGRGGETIKGLQQHSGARIQIDQASTPCKISMSGPQHTLNEATRMIQDILNGGNAAQYSINAPPPQSTAAPYGGYGPPAGGGYGAPTYGGGYPGGPAPGGYGGGYGAPSQGYGAPAPYGGGYGAPSGGGYGAPSQGGGYPQGGYGGYQPPQDPTPGGYDHGYGAPSSGGYSHGYSQPTPAVSSAWQALQDGEGRTYYYNSQTGVSQWEKPEGM